MQENGRLPSTRLKLGSAKDVGVDEDSVFEEDSGSSPGVASKTVTTATNSGESKFGRDVNRVDGSVPKSPTKRTARVVEVVYVEEEIHTDNGLHSPTRKMAKSMSPSAISSSLCSNGPVHKLGEEVSLEIAVSSDKTKPKVSLQVMYYRKTGIFQRYNNFAQLPVVNPLTFLN